VDLGGEIWGEQVHAAHDGVVDRVQRGPNDDHGGEYVRLSHRGGTVFTQYFHLAAIARGIEPGVSVKAGDVLGLLGDTGVKESSPHLHFTISVRLSKELPERYMDPEPLIALWPLRIPVAGSEVGLVTLVAKPGVPLGSALFRQRRRLAAKRKRAAEPASTERGKEDAADETDNSGAQDAPPAESPEP
jgi:murein DD-endopeptidase MepM/ murein hydrolase activator NlpD